MKGKDKSRLFDVQTSDFVDGPYSLVKNLGYEVGAFFQLFFDNLSTVLSVLTALIGTLEGVFPKESTILADVVWGKMATGLGISIFWGNVFYSFQASRLTRLHGKEYTAMPYGINTPAAFSFIFGIIVPTFFKELDGGMSPDDAFMQAYKVSLAANFMVGVINACVSAFGPLIIRFVPPAALLAPIAGIGFAFLGIGQVSCNFGQPLVGFLPIMFVFIGWGAGIKIGGVVPEAATVLLVGTVLGWVDPATRGEVDDQGDGYGLAAKLFQAETVLGNFQARPVAVSEMVEGLGELDRFLGLVFPIGISASCLTVMCLLSARNAGDSFPIRQTMLVDGLGTCIGAMCGSPFGTVVYIGQPAHKAGGATVGYSFLNGVAYLVLSMSGFFVILWAIFPCQAVGPTILFIGLLMCKDSSQGLPGRHLALFFFGLFPSVADYLTGAIPAGSISGDAQWGLYALKHGAMLVSFFWCGILTYVVDRYWVHAAVWSMFAAVFASAGLIHMPVAGFSDEYVEADGALKSQFEMGTWGPFVDGGDQPCSGPACGARQWRFMTSYLMMGAVSAIFYGFQKFGFGPPPEEDLDSMLVSAEEWDNLKDDSSSTGKAAHASKYVAEDENNHDAGVEDDDATPSEPGDSVQSVIPRRMSPRVTPNPGEGEGGGGGGMPPPALKAPGSRRFGPGGGGAAAPGEAGRGAGGAAAAAAARGEAEGPPAGAAAAAATASSPDEVHRVAFPAQAAPVRTMAVTSVGDGPGGDGAGH